MDQMLMGLLGGQQDQGQASSTAPMGGRQLPLGVDPQAGDKKLNTILQLLAMMLMRGQMPAQQQPMQQAPQQPAMPPQGLPAPQNPMQGSAMPQMPYGG